jgi:hypothetical protein
MSVTTAGVLNRSAGILRSGTGSQIEEPHELDRYARSLQGAFLSRSVLSTTSAQIDRTSTTSTPISGTEPPNMRPLDSTHTEHLFPGVAKDRPDTVERSPIRVTHRWEGTVVAVDDDYFEAKLTPLSGDGPEVLAELSLEDVSADDISLLAPGAVFYITVGQVRQAGGRIMRTSTVRFRRLGLWHEDDVRFLRARAKKRRAALGFEETAE